VSKFAEKNVNIDGNQGFKFWGEKKLTNSSKVKGFSKSLPEKNLRLALDYCLLSKSTWWIFTGPLQMLLSGSMSRVSVTVRLHVTTTKKLWCFFHFPSYQNVMQYSFSRTKSQSSLLAARLNHKTHEINPQQSKFHVQPTPSAWILDHKAANLQVHYTWPQTPGHFGKCKACGARVFWRRKRKSALRTFIFSARVFSASFEGSSNRSSHARCLPVVRWGGVRTTKVLLLLVA